MTSTFTCSLSVKHVAVVEPIATTLAGGSGDDAKLPSTLVKLKWLRRWVMANSEDDGAKNATHHSFAGIGLQLPDKGNTNKALTTRTR